MCQKVKCNSIKAKTKSTILLTFRVESEGESDLCDPLKKLSDKKHVFTITDKESIVSQNRASNFVTFSLFVSLCTLNLQNLF